MKKIFSFFSGAGFLDLGFELCDGNYSVDLVNEYSSSFMEAYIHSREIMHLDPPRYGHFNVDINSFFETNKNIELLQHMQSSKADNSLIGFIGGPPCPDFSVGGKNKGRNGENGKLSFSYINLIAASRPDFFLFENVKGLWKTKRHRKFYEFLKEVLHLAGYSTTERLTNSLEFGVPQDRERIFLFGIKSKLLNDEQIDNNEILNFPWDRYITHNLEKAKQCEWPELNQFGNDIDCPDNIDVELTVQHWFNKNNVELHNNSNSYFTPRAGLHRMQMVDEGDVSRKSFKRLHRWRYSPTAAYGNNEVHLHPYKARRLSAAEALAIQSLPSAFELPSDMSLSDMFKVIGNGVPFELALGIARTINDFLDTICE